MPIAKISYDDPHSSGRHSKKYHNNNRKDISFWTGTTNFDSTSSSKFLSIYRFMYMLSSVQLANCKIYIHRSRWGDPKTFQSRSLGRFTHNDIGRNFTALSRFHGQQIPTRFWRNIPGKVWLCTSRLYRHGTCSLRHSRTVSGILFLNYSLDIWVSGRGRLTLHAQAYLGF
jgi:hypothetical protein